MVTDLHFVSVLFLSSPLCVIEEGFPALLRAPTAVLDLVLCEVWFYPLAWLPPPSHFTKAAHLIRAAFISNRRKQKTQNRCTGWRKVLDFCWFQFSCSTKASGSSKSAPGWSTSSNKCHCSKNTGGFITVCKQLRRSQIENH